MIKITYLGYSCFHIEGADGVSVVTDPYNDNKGFTLPKDLTADIVLVSHSHPAHSCASVVNGQPAIVQGAGERELGKITVSGISSYHDSKKGTVLGRNTVFVWNMKGNRFAHLGDLGVLLGKEDLARLGELDVLFVPIGSRNTLDQNSLKILIGRINVKYIIPMKYKCSYNYRELYSLQDFLKDKDSKRIVMPQKPNQFLFEKKEQHEGDHLIVPLQYLVL